MRTLTQRLFLFSIGILVSLCSFSQIELPALFTDNMVLQQNSQAPIWGKTKANTTVAIKTSWNNKEYSVKADETGNWKTNLETVAAGGPYTITITSNETKTLNNVMLGEVWICSGQSNMEMPLAGWGKILDYENEIAQANYPNIRLLQVQKATATTPLDDVNVDGDSWQLCSPETIEYFSATAYFFGRNLHQSLDIPIGLIHTSWGGTVAEAWTSAESLNTMPYFVDKVSSFSQVPNDLEQEKQMVAQKQKEWHTQIQTKDFGLKDGKAVAAQTNYDDSKWAVASLPGFWEKDELPDFDGVVWYRKTIELPNTWTNTELTLSLGTIDDNDISYFNGVEVGQTTGHNIERKYTIPAHLVKKGKAVISVRVMDTGGDGGFYDGSKNLYLANAKGERLELAGNWNYKVALNLDEIGSYPQLVSENPNHPTTLYNAMIAPLVPYKIKGAIWYQGESNVGRANQYKILFPLMINDWRTKWGYEFPFYFVQLANFLKVVDTPTESSWAELREAQLNTLNLNNTGMAVIIDAGEADDIHPKDKQTVGNRLALQARENTYKQDIIASGPIYESYSIENGTIVLKFKASEAKLVAKGDELKGFSMAGPDMKFYWATAEIQGDSIVVSSPDVAFPIAVRYAWSDNPIANLYNDAGLPASPFRTDK